MHPIRQTWIVRSILSPWCIRKGDGSSYSRKHKFNTKRSTESELVGASDMLPQVLCSLYFIESQGYPVDHIIFNQYNMATMRLEVNGDFSISKRTNHIKSKFFFIKYKLEDGYIEVQHFPTEKFLSDVLNKPKQGTPFWLDRSCLKNVPVEYVDEVERNMTHTLSPPPRMNNLVWRKQTRKIQDAFTTWVCWERSLRNAVVPWVNGYKFQEWTKDRYSWYT